MIVKSATLKNWEQNNNYNNRRRNFDYQAGEYVLELKRDPTKLGIRTTGPYRIEQVHTNGTLTIRRGPGLIDRINIRRLRPYFRR